MGLLPETETPLQKAECVIAVQNTLINSLLAAVTRLRSQIESCDTERVQA